MDSHFKGDPVLAETYSKIVTDLPYVYEQGTSICFAGKHGVGKTMVSICILKRAVEKSFSGLYTTFTDIVAVMTGSEGSDRFDSRKELMTVDFLVIDEFDSRYIGTDNAANLFGRTLEDIFRTRLQNKLPLIMCTNGPDAMDGFVGPIKQSLSSLMNRVQTIAVLGKDFRPGNKRSI